MTNKWVDIEWLKKSVIILGILAIIGAIVMAIAVPVIKGSQFEVSINTYYNQADQAANPSQFSSSLRNLNIALEREGMTEGSVDVINPPEAKMEYKRAQFSLLADRADTLVNKDLSSTEVSTGLTELKATLNKTSTSTYGFWLNSQGGWWLQLWIPLIIVAAGIATIITGVLLPDRIRIKVRAAKTAAT